MTQKLKYERPFIKKMNMGLMNKFGTQSESEAVRDIDGVAVKALVNEFGSPLFVLSERQIRRNYRAAVRAFKTRYPKVQFAWSYKTNYLNAVCSIFHQEGSWAEVVSGFEYRKTLSNGVPGHHIIFNGPQKSTEELLLAIQNNSLIHIDHFDELYALIPLCQEHGSKPRVAIRVNMDTGIYPLWDRFGFNYENGQAWSAITKIINSGTMQLVGLHCHIGTFVLSASAYGVAAAKMSALALQCNAVLTTPIEYLDLGGGFPSTNTLKGAYLPGVDTVPSVDDFAEAITTTLLDAGFKQDELPLLILESGRVLIDDAGYLLGSVIANKRLADGRRAVVADFGVNTLFTSLWYDHKISPAQDVSPHTDTVTLYGPLCMNIDMIRESVNLPALQPGDNLVVHKVGAYNMTQWMQFISLRPAIVLIDEEHRPHLIRKAETLEYMEAPEVLPEYLREAKEAT
ncbi:type III PLP-dependent enzyme domain-containing protein [Mucilaginibacter pedocola]|uniref:Diaminopimelate decarboxylase n=1 Tax=Mucilaginibacter pedocola TaxID=1792845 RepID=A0A1S9P897_9SPHI|nr:diaminopimelate decarboxylase [Mucilaginibacter pedocola]OOQ57181.1 diaminopimelate decarboxylase [Mucilaginibacter pedocola]